MRVNRILERLAFYNIQGHEGFRAEKYKCPAGFWTIGFGHNLDVSGKTLTTITIEDATALLDDDWKDAVLQSTKFDFSHAMDKVRAMVLPCMVYQMGFEGVSGFGGMIRAIQNGNYTKAAHEMLDSKWGTVDSPKRALEMSHIMESGFVGDWFKAIHDVNGFTKEQNKERRNQINNLILGETNA